MNKSLPDISYERNMNHNYMILTSCDFFGSSSDNNDFRKKMILENNIPGLLPVKCRHINGQVRYYYEINSLQSLERLYNKKEMDYEELKHILMGCVKLFNILEEYLLDGSQIVLSTEYIYMDIDRLELYFVCYPEYEGDVREAFVDFIDMILTKIDHTDNDAVMLGYRVYRYTKNPNYIISEISHIIEASIPEDVNAKEQEVLYNRGMASVSYFDDEVFEEEEEEKEEPRIDKRFKFGIKSKPKDKSKSDTKNNKEKVKAKSNDVKGMIFSIMVALCAIALIILADIVPSMEAVKNNEIYLYGAIAMSLAGAMLFAVSHSKKKKLEKAKAQLNCDDDKETLSDEETLSDNDYVHEIMPNNGTPNYGTPKYATPQPSRLSSSVSANPVNSIKREAVGTTFLNESTIEERVLIGRVNGREVTIPLSKFPITLGKQAGVSDIIVDDNAVSKMHARFEEMDGKVYIYDLNSTNGTVKNGAMLDINHPVVLEPGDRLRFGRSSFTYC